MGFADELAKKASVRGSLSEQQKHFCTEMAETFVNDKLPRFKELCTIYANEGRRKIDMSYGGPNVETRNNPLKIKYPAIKAAAKDAAKQIEAELRKEGFKSLSVIPSVFDDDYGTYSIEVRIKAEW